MPGTNFQFILESGLENVIYKNSFLLKVGKYFTIIFFKISLAYQSDDISLY